LKGRKFDPNNILKQYEVVTKLGEGGFGKVMLGICI